MELTKRKLEDENDVSLKSNNNEVFIFLSFIILYPHSLILSISFISRYLQCYERVQDYEFHVDYTRQWQVKV